MPNARLFHGLLFVAALVVPGCTAPHEAGPGLMGAGSWTWVWEGDFPERPVGGWGNTHGEIVVDATGRLHISFDVAPAIRVFARDGAPLAAWGDEFAGGVHGMTIARDPPWELGPSESVQG